MTKNLLKATDQFLFYPLLVTFLKKIIFNGIYNFLSDEKLLTPNQFGFHLCRSCVNQLLAITPEIFEAFDCNPPIRKIPKSS